MPTYITKYVTWHQRSGDWRCRSGFATEQGAYADAQADLERGLLEVEARLASSRFLMGDIFTDADLRLLPTVVRYDAVYNSLFRCTRRRIAADCPNLQAWMQDVWLMPCAGSMQVGPHLCCVGIPEFMRTGHAAVPNMCYEGAGWREGGI